MPVEKSLIREKVVGVPRLKIPINSPMLFCQGCQHPLIGRIVAELLDEMGLDKDTILCSGIGCHGVICGFINVDSFIPASGHGRAPDVATGAKRTLGKKSFCLTIQGDGDAIAIGTEPLIQAAARGERLTVIMLNNQCYGTTGGQLAPTSLLGQKTPTTPLGRSQKEGYPIRTAELLAGLDGVAYSARCAITGAGNYHKTKKCVRRAMQKQVDDLGFGFVEIMSVCPTNWHMTPIDCITYMEDKIIPEFPLGEFKNMEPENHENSRKA